MRILLDTNIVVHREASKVYNQDIGLLFNWIDKMHFEKCVHPVTIQEISTYQDASVVDTMKIKIQNYNVLKSLSSDNEMIAHLRQSDKTSNDANDTEILKEVLTGRVNFLITEDKEIHRKAKALGISDRVYKIDAFIEKLVFENPELIDYKVLSVRKDLFGNINLNDDFFETFKQDYKEFEKWYQSKSDQSVYVCVIDEEVKAFLFLKVEDTNEAYGDIHPQFKPKKRLKIGTFKVVSTGYKLGERFLKIIFDNALINSVDEIYVTLFEQREEQQRLARLLQEWGFKPWGTKTTSNGIENVYVRDFSKTVLDNPKESFPYIHRQSRVFVTPIYPEYHTNLFPDSILNNESPDDFVENEPQRNALQKVFISRSYFKNLNTGDIILFYRTGGKYAGVITTLGVVESVILDIADESEFIRLCRKRSVFDDNGLKKWWNYSKYTKPFIVNFLYIDSFPMPKVNLEKLVEIGLIRSYEDVPRGFVQIENGKFEEFLKVARANESYIIN